MVQVICLATCFAGTLTCDFVLKPGDCREGNYTDLETNAWATN